MANSSDVNVRLISKSFTVNKIIFILKGFYFTAVTIYLIQSRKSFWLTDTMNKGLSYLKNPQVKILRFSISIYWEMSVSQFCIEHVRVLWIYLEKIVGFFVVNNR